MKRTHAIAAMAALAGALSLAGCVAQGKPTATTVPAPIPTPVPAPPPEAPKPLSMPQTVVELPQPQPVPAEAFELATQPTEPAPAAATVIRTPRRPPAQTAKPDPTPVVTTPPEPERPTIQEIIPAAEQKRLQKEATDNRNEARQILDKLKGRRMTAQQKTDAGLVEGFITQSSDAEKRGDLRQAAALADRCVILARGLQGGK